MGENVLQSVRPAPLIPASATPAPATPASMMPAALIQVPTPPDATDIVVDPGNPLHAAWLDAADAQVAQHAWQALAFVRECCSLFIPAEQASITGNMAELQNLEMRARSLLTVGKAMLGEWALDFAQLTHATIAAQWHVLRGAELVLEWRHDRGRAEYAAAIAETRRSAALAEAVLPKLPPVRGVLDTAALLPTFVNLQNASAPMFEAMARQCDAELLLMDGRLAEYVGVMRGMAAEVRRTADGMLAAGADTPAVHQVSVRLRGLADNMLARSDAVDQRSATRPPYPLPLGDKVFIIHGHAKAEYLELEKLLNGRFGLAGRVVVLKDEAGQSQTLIAKFEAWANQCCFAIALLTPDDIVSKPAAKGGSYAQARPNALFEVGWFFGRFGPKRLCIVKQQDTQLPSDLGGVSTVDYITDVSEKVPQLEQELRVAGVLPPA